MKTTTILAALTFTLSMGVYADNAERVATCGGVLADLNTGEHEDWENRQFKIEVGEGGSVLFYPVEIETRAKRHVIEQVYAAKLIEDNKIVAVDFSSDHMITKIRLNLETKTVTEYSSMGEGSDFAYLGVCTDYLIL